MCLAFWNLRGAIVPVIDLRTRLGLPAVAGTATTVIVVLTVIGTNGRRDFGLVVDAVSDVSHLNQSDVQATPSGITVSDRNLRTRARHRSANA